MGGMSGGQRVDEDLLVGRISLKVGYASPRLVLGIVVGADVADAIGRQTPQLAPQPFCVRAPSDHHLLSHCVAPPSPPPPALLLLVPVPVLVVLALLVLLAVLRWLPAPRRPAACELRECVGEYNDALDTEPSLWLGDSDGLLLAVWSMGLWGFAAINKGRGMTRARASRGMGSNPRGTCTIPYLRVEARGPRPASSSPSLALALVEWEWELEVECKYACCAWTPLVLEAPAG
ncbi:hypothetical protein B0H13DRAFT_2433576 [Mycena leptocephala]|nr:hypothetical protein B0H13DRAFT_2433576 [Mycena leptocephala]